MSVWRAYHSTCGLGSNKQEVSYRKFIQLWQEFFPDVVVAKPMTDLCFTCQQNTTKLQCAANLSDLEKSECIAAQQQQVHIPSNPMQPGPIYFKMPRKCGIFGIMCEGIPQQVNFLIDESVCAGKGANTTISYVHYFLQNHGLGETNAHFHADNCLNCFSFDHILLFNCGTYQIRSRPRFWFVKEVIQGVVRFVSLRIRLTCGDLQ